MREVWRDVLGFENSYQVSNLGRIRGIDRRITRTSWAGTEYTCLYKGKILVPRKNSQGYLLAHLSSGKSKNYSLHRLIAASFIPNPNNLPEVNHINKDKLDNRVENLEWCTSSYNTNYSVSKDVYLYKEDQSVYAVSYTKAAELTGLSRPSVANLKNQKRNSVNGWKLLEV